MVSPLWHLVGRLPRGEITADGRWEGQLGSLRGCAEALRETRSSGRNRDFVALPAGRRRAKLTFTAQADAS